MAKLIVMFNDQVLNEVHVGANEPVKIGRHPTNQITLDNPAVSRFHAEIYRQGHPFFVEDKNSTNGVFINNIKVNWKQGIQNGDRITVGKHTILFRLEPSDDPDGRNVSLADIDGTIAIDSFGKIKR